MVLGIISEKNQDEQGQYGREEGHPFRTENPQGQGPETAAPAVWEMVFSVSIAEMGSSMSSLSFFSSLPPGLFLSTSTSI